MSDLSEFLLAQFAADEAAAREAFTLPADAQWCEHWMQPGIRHLVRNCDIECLICNDDDWCGGPSRTAGAHIARHDPARVLTECDAKRRIVLLANAARDDDDDLLDQVRVMTLRLLALPYADHPDYRDEWRP